ncbi:glycoside hydrolase family 16 protein [Nocardioides jiangxiensis]|uniref:Glycoside hydrolase family 16 protein n=1 Tax=Nocardioides jiangxiensis TaxID=3064524 RepID=A0ABT9B2P4_9ACTN|nr:glycoside hydrolase family 16 protein [Nocardioides sp. WY-20]MDO7869120.1 glycoside hydrolase family 16 protein [Nocardioides sp. WY-20]
MFTRLRSRSILAVAGLTAATALAVVGPGGSADAAWGPYCGSTIRKAGGGTWKCTFSDDFSGRSLDTTKWSPLLTSNTGVQTPDCRIDNPDTLSVGGGYISLSTVDTGSDFVCQGPSWSTDFTTHYQSGGITSRNSFAQTYGRYEFRAAFPGSTSAGLHSALWLWPKELVYGADSGELDVAEYYTGAPGRVVPTVHYDDGGLDPDKTDWHCYVANPGAFHTYAMEWTPTSLTFLYDGQTCLVDTWLSGALAKPAPFDQDFFMILNQSIGAGFNAPTEATEFPGTMKVDYVRVWK